MIRTLTLLIILWLAACKCPKKVVNDKTQDELDFTKYTLVTVIDYTEVSGCGFIFSLNDGAKLIPENMPDTLKKADVKVRILYKETNLANICMAGKTISLLDVKPYE